MKNCVKDCMVVSAVACLAAATLSAAEFSATATITSTNGTVRTIPLAVTAEPDGGRRVTVKAADAQDAKWVEVWASCAMAKKGEDGFWLSQRGLLGLFTRDAGVWHSSRVMRACGTPRATG